MRREINLYFQPRDIPSRLALTRFYTDNKFGLFIDIRSRADTPMHGSGVRLVNTKDVEVDRKT